MKAAKIKPINAKMYVCAKYSEYVNAFLSAHTSTCYFKGIIMSASAIDVPMLPPTLKGMSFP